MWGGVEEAAVGASVCSPLLRPVDSGRTMRQTPGQCMPLPLASWIVAVALEGLCGDQGQSRGREAWWKAVCNRGLGSLR